MKKGYILASASERRKILLRRIVKKFKIIPSKVKESEISAKTPETFTVKAAIAKAEEVALKQPNSIVVGADTIVVLGEKILGKPKNNKEAIAMLKALSGTTHRVITGIALVDSDTFRKNADFEITKVKMKKVSEEDILAYVKDKKPLDKAGGYGIQELDEVFIDRISGDYDNVVGLPVKKLRKMLKEFLK